MNKTVSFKWFVDVILFACFLVAFFLDQTGLEAHQWLGVIAGGLATYHLVTHWDWFSTVTERFFGKTSTRARLYYLMDMLLFGSFNIIGFTGLLISSWLNLSLTNYDFWLTLHIQSSIMALVLTVIKIALHWRWVISTAKRTFSVPAQPIPQVSPVLKRLPPAVPVTANQPISRRDFLKMMGVVGVASLVALGSAASSLEETLQSINQDTGQTADQTIAQNTNNGTTDSQTSQFVAPSDTSNQTCFVQCNRMCSYPGHCRRYTDTDGNDRCDYGECA